MASYDNLLAEQPWSFRPAFSDAWNISDLFTMENEALTKALQSSIAGDVFSAEMLPYTLYTKAADASASTPSHTPTVSGVSSENEALASSSKQQRRSVASTPVARPPPPSGRIAKRKPRPSKRAATTTFIATNPENFMQMVQQVTGVRIDGCGASVAVLKPEPRRAADGLMPTLDTSVFLLDSSASSVLSMPSAAAVAAPEHYFDSFCSFPTLESWNV